MCAYLSHLFKSQIKHKIIDILLSIVIFSNHVEKYVIMTPCFCFKVEVNVKEMLKKHELTKALATKELEWSAVCIKRS